MGSALKRCFQSIFYKALLNVFYSTTCYAKGCCCLRDLPGRTTRTGVAEQQRTGVDKYSG